MALDALAARVAVARHEVLPNAIVLLRHHDNRSALGDGRRPKVKGRRDGLRPAAILPANPVVGLWDLRHEQARGKGAGGMGGWHERVA